MQSESLAERGPEGWRATLVGAGCLTAVLPIFSPTAALAPRSLQPSEMTTFELMSVLQQAGWECR
eukprot:5343855-Alexandrium_andersonii.AAC.1